jgi:hypothetical protein
MRNGKRSASVLVVWILALSGTGAWLSGQSVKHHGDLWSVGGAGTGLLGRMCQAAARAGLSCARTAKGRWAEIALPVPTFSRDVTIAVRTVNVPVAFLSLAYFVFTGAWFAFTAACVGMAPRDTASRWCWDCVARWSRCSTSARWPWGSHPRACGAPRCFIVPAAIITPLRIGPFRSRSGQPGPRF